MSRPVTAHDSDQPGTMRAMLLTEIDHVAIAVSDLEAAIQYYEQTFGCHRRTTARSSTPTVLRKRCSKSPTPTSSC